MDITTVMNKLDISKFGALWALLSGGWKGLGLYFVEAVTKLLKKLPPEELKNYAGIIKQVMELLKMIVNDWVPEKYKAAGVKTVEAIAALATHLEDGEYTQEELDVDIDNIEACINAWKSI